MTCCGVATIGFGLTGVLEAELPPTPLASSVLVLFVPLFCCCCCCCCIISLDEEAAELILAKCFFCSADVIILT